MSAPLVAPSELAALRTVAERGLQSVVIIHKRTYADTNPYSDDEVVATETNITTTGWLRTVPVGDISSINGRAAVVTSHRLLVPEGTDISSGDRVEVDGSEYIVQETTRSNTWRVLIRCQLERIE